MIDQHSLNKKLYERHNAPKGIQLSIQFSDWTMHAPHRWKMEMKVNAFAVLLMNLAEQNII
jgi:hypothetical protein